MEHDKLRHSLESLGIHPCDYKVLKLLPLVYVGWADGKMEPLKRERIESFAARHFDLSADGYAVLERWLNRRPSHGYVAEGLHDMYFLARASDDMELDFSELPALLSYAEGVARSTPKALDEPEAVTPSQDSALEEIARELHVDHGQSWAQLLDDLR